MDLKTKMFLGFCNFTLLLTLRIPISAETKTMVNPQDRLGYVWIPPGVFEMGCPGDDTFECFGNELPRHRITLTKGYWIGETEVTQEAYRLLMKTNPSHVEGSRIPVEHVSWEDARMFCTSAGMRLPTEAEWEWAARAGGTASRYGPISELGQFSWYRGNSAGQPSEVAHKRINPYGLYDMLGNVWEWTADWYAPYSADSLVDPRGPSNGKHHVIRGASWNDFSLDLRISVRDGVPLAGGDNSRDYDDFSVGFRCARN